MKQCKLLPPSYARKPTEVNVRINKYGNPSAVLTFRSNTSISYRTVEILDYRVYSSINISMACEYNDEMSKEWEMFVERLYWLKEKGYPTYLVNDAKVKELMNEEKWI